MAGGPGMVGGRFAGVTQVGKAEEVKVVARAGGHVVLIFGPPGPQPDLGESGYADESRALRSAQPESASSGLAAQSAFSSSSSPFDPVPSQTIGFIPFQTMTTSDNSTCQGKGISCPQASKPALRRFVMRPLSCRSVSWVGGWTIHTASPWLATSRLPSLLKVSCWTGFWQ